MREIHRFFEVLSARGPPPPPDAPRVGIVGSAEVQEAQALLNPAHRFRESSPTIEEACQSIFGKTRMPLTHLLSPCVTGCGGCRGTGPGPTGVRADAAILRGDSVAWRPSRWSIHWKKSSSPVARQPCTVALPTSEELPSQSPHVAGH